MTTTATGAIRKTVLVDFAPADAWELFTTRIGTWWPVESHSYGGGDVTAVVLEPHVGGRLYEVTAAGERGWALVRVWEPPTRLVLDWQIGSGAGTEVEVRFAPEGPGARLELEHRGLTAPETQARYGAGWDGVLAACAAAAR